EVATVVLVLFPELEPAEELELAAAELPHADTRTIRAERDERRTSLPALVALTWEFCLLENTRIKNCPL
ncbi:MAG: hypothetical protein M0Z39_04590, partial [Actinomycetota bacterium]|nr:hypothetical protein [Actinomycetota bacterium]